MSKKSIENTTGPLLHTVFLVKKPRKPKRSIPFRTSHSQINSNQPSSHSQSYRLSCCLRRTRSGGQ